MAAAVLGPLRANFQQALKCNSSENRTGSTSSGSGNHASWCARGYLGIPHFFMVLRWLNPWFSRASNTDPTTRFGRVLLPNFRPAWTAQLGLSLVCSSDSGWLATSTPISGALYACIPPLRPVLGMDPGRTAHHLPETGPPLPWARCYARRWSSSLLGENEPATCCLTWETLVSPSFTGPGACAGRG